MHVYISFIQSAIDVLANTVENEHILCEEECDDEKGKKWCMVDKPIDKTCTLLWRMHRYLYPISLI
jgi:hypothetical protein